MSSIVLVGAPVPDGPARDHGWEADALGNWVVRSVAGPGSTERVRTSPARYFVGRTAPGGTSWRARPTLDPGGWTQRYLLQAVPEPETAGAVLGAVGPVRGVLVRGGSSE